MEAIYFNSPPDFRNWLEANHQTSTELLVGFYKVGSGKCNMTWSEAVDEALCFGWIDGVKKSVDHERYTHRFSPRRRNSIWSLVNIKKVEQLTEAGRMREAGLYIFNSRKPDSSGIYSFEQKNIQLSGELEKQFRDNKAAWEFFEQQPPSYRKAVIRHIMSAKQPATQQSRMLKLIAACMEQKRL
jgi:uncharacterized protein YdeI (YjbR/CyaY-like superfamily)